MKKVIRNMFILFLMIGVSMANIGFGQQRHPEIIADNSEMHIENLGFGDSGKHPEIVEVTLENNVEIESTVEI